MTLKTLHLTNAWHATSGGVGTFYRSLLQAANETGHELRLVVPAERDEVEEIGRFGRIYHVQSAQAPRNRSYRMLYPQHYLRPGGRLCRILNTERPHLIEICDKYTLPYMGGLLRVGKLKGVDLRVPVLGLSCERMDENMFAYFGGSPGGLRKAFCQWYMKYIYFPQFDHHIANSEHTAEELLAASHGHKTRRGVWVCPMGVDSAGFAPELRSSELRARLAARAGGGPESALLLYVGRLAPEKNLPLLAETLAELTAPGGRDYRLLIAGQGMSQAALQRACQERAPGRACFLDHIADREELAALYASSDVFVHPNPREPFGIAPLEAMASGLALVAPNCGGITSYANETNAWLAKPDARSFARAVESALCQPGARREAALHTAAAYDWRQVSRDFLAFYRDMAALYRGELTAPAREPRFYSTLGDYWGREIDRASPASIITSAKPD